MLMLLKAAPRRIEALLDSAARTSAEMALQTVLSWYPKLSLARLYTMRDGAADLLETAYTQVNRLATAMVGWFPHTEYTPVLDDAGTPIAPLPITALADDSSSAGGRARGGQGSQPARSSSSYLYHDDLSDSGSSRTLPKDTSRRTSAKSADVGPSKAREDLTGPKQPEATAVPEGPTAPEQAVPTVTPVPTTAPTASTALPTSIVPDA